MIIEKLKFMQLSNITITLPQYHILQVLSWLLKYLKFIQLSIITINILPLKNLHPTTNP